MKTKISLLSLILIFLFIGCKKEEINTSETPKPTSMTDLQSSSTFSWQNIKKIKVKIQGSHLMTTTIKSTNGDIYFKGMVNPATKVETTIAIPSTVNEVIVNYGPFSKTITILNNTIDCTFNLNSF